MAGQTDLRIDPTRRRSLRDLLASALGTLTERDIDAYVVSYTILPDFDLADYFNQGWGRMCNTGDPEAEVALRAGNGAPEERSHASQRGKAGRGPVISVRRITRT